MEVYAGDLVGLFLSEREKHYKIDIFQTSPKCTRACRSNDHGEKLK